MENNKQSLYTKYRPSNFDEVIGQKVAKDILINSISKNKINHAYLFFGIRGTGKTTLARIFAKSINCENKNGYNPCNECEICRTINNGSAFDIIEIDAASNNGVDEIRLIKENTSFLTTSTKYKVYIIDEVHMLTKAAFNALLKTLEEPPLNTIFLLATTEIQKIPLTVLSRTIIINLEVISDKNIKKGLKVVLEGEKIEYDDHAIDYIVMISGGSLRDAISSLETVLLYNNELSVDNVILALGLISKSKVSNLLLNNIDELINEIDNSDKDPFKISQLIMEVCIDFIKEGNNKYIDFLNKIIRISNTIKDPLLLKIALKTSIYSININDNVSRETSSSDGITEKTNNTENYEKSGKLLEDRKNTNSIENIENKQKNNDEIKRVIHISEDENTENIAEKSLPNEEKNKPNIITDYADINNYVYIIKNNDSDVLSKVKNRWKFIDNYITSSEYKDVVSSLVKTIPLACAGKTLVVGFHNDLQINEFKVISLSPLFFKFIKDIIGEYKFVLPVSESAWSKLMAIKDGIELSDIHTDVNLNIFDYIDNPTETHKNKLNNLFGEGNVENE